MGRRASKIILSVQERNELECLLRTHSTSQQLARRVQIILLAADGLSVSRNCKSVGCLAQEREKSSVRTVSIDEMSGIQALERAAPSLPLPGDGGAASCVQ